ncbi:MAG TPA: CoA pyrophosphatase [Solirubrobacteraceae bacterium]|nr:CoA pyrophosphatase [Solirubrobacteraceae bacterium]
MSSAPSSLPEALREVLLDPGAVTAMEVHGRTKAAVLVPLYEHEGALHAVFTRRHSDLRSHAGEISFPGGRRDKGDADLLGTALREAEEEIGLPSDAVRVLGALSPTPTVATNFGVYPFVGLIEPGRQWTLSPREVDEVLELRLGDLRAAGTRRRLLHRGIPFRSIVYDVSDKAVIWGATARIVTDLLARIDPLLDEPSG